MMTQIRGIATHYEQLGLTGKPLLLLHGWGPKTVSLEAHMMPLAHQFKKDFRVTLVDFPGHGGTSEPAETWGIEQFALWTLALMDSLGIQKTDVIAHSFGGRVAIWIAANKPDRVNRLVLTGCAGLRPKRKIKTAARNALYKSARFILQSAAVIPGWSKGAGAKLLMLREKTASADYLAAPLSMRATFVRIVREDLRPLLPKVPHQTLLVYGENDTATPLWMGKTMEKEMPEATLLVYGGEGHWAYREQLPRFANAAEAFLQEDFTL